VDVSFTDVTAVTDSDYTATSGTVNIGEVFSATAIDDNLAEDAETFEVALDVDSAGITSADYENVEVDTTAVTTTITDETIPGEDDTVTVQLVATDVDGNELSSSAIEEGDVAYYKTILVDGAGVEIAGATGTVDVSFTDVTAVTDSDYTATSGTVNIGEVFSATAIDDNLAEDAETFEV
ncbi:MAG: hypothetical protein GY702_13695, partial [Desulfobulbaceae bacterium]|nr:hypothetical protein [Desulfobulbaceae bacterium]